MYSDDESISQKHPYNMTDDDSGKIHQKKAKSLESDRHNNLNKKYKLDNQKISKEFK
jgi:hypothetical protein